MNIRQPRLFHEPQKEPMTYHNRTENDAALQFATERAKPEILTLTRGTAAEAQVLVTQKGQELHSVKKLLDAYLPKPERRTGTTTLTDPDSFVAFVNRAKNPHSVIYMDEKAPSLLAVFDHDERGEDGTATARWGQHRALYQVEISDEWRAWMKADNNSLSQRDFAELVEERALDLLDPAEAAGDPTVALAAKLGLKLSAPGEVIEASRGLKLRAEINVGEAVTLSSGETELHFTEAHRGVDGQPLLVPTAFLIGVPVLKGAPRDVLLARLRYRRVAGQPRVMWLVNLHRPDEVMRAAVGEVILDVAARTGVEVLKGAPPTRG